MPIDLAGEIAGELRLRWPEMGVRYSEDLARAVLARLESLGLAVVPIEPPEEMKLAGGKIIPEYEGSAASISAQTYRAMIKAAK